MKSGITLIDAAERNRQIANTYPIPDDESKRRIKPGDLVKVGVEGFHVHLTQDSVMDGERFWVRIKRVRRGKFKGNITNDLEFTSEHGLGLGDTIAFEARHIIDIETKEQRRADVMQPFVNIVAIEKDAQPSQKWKNPAS